MIHSSSATLIQVLGNPQGLGLGPVPAALQGGTASHLLSLAAHLVPGAGQSNPASRECSPSSGNRSSADADHRPEPTAGAGSCSDVIRGWLADGAKPETIAILVRDQRDRDRVATALGERGMKVRAVERERVPAGTPVVMTMHRAKGKEFAHVLLFGISESSIPEAQRAYVFDPDAQAEAVLRERALLYVAATRARDALAVSWSGKASGLLPQPIRTATAQTE